MVDGDMTVWLQPEVWQSNVLWQSYNLEIILALVNFLLCPLQILKDEQKQKESSFVINNNNKNN